MEMPAFNTNGVILFYLFIYLFIIIISFSQPDQQVTAAQEKQKSKYHRSLNKGVKTYKIEVGMSVVKNQRNDSHRERENGGKMD